MLSWSPASTVKEGYLERGISLERDTLREGYLERGIPREPLEGYLDSTLSVHRLLALYVLTTAGV